MDDIVQRLEVKWQHREGAPVRKIGQLVRESVEAADEIKRLRRALEAIKEAAELGDTDACHELARRALINKA